MIPNFTRFGDNAIALIRFGSHAPKLDWIWHTARIPNLIGLGTQIPNSGSFIYGSVQRHLPYYVNTEAAQPSNDDPQQPNGCQGGSTIYANGLDLENQTVPNPPRKGATH